MVLKLGKIQTDTANILSMYNVTVKAEIELDDQILYGKVMFRAIFFFFFTLV